MRNFLKKMKYIIAGIVPAINILLTNFTVYASATSSEYDFDWITTSDNGTFSELTDTVKQTGGSFYQLVMAIGVTGLVISFIISGTCIALGRTGNKRSDNIAQLGYIAIAGIVIFGAMSFVGYFRSIGTNL